MPEKTIIESRVSSSAHNLKTISAESTGTVNARRPLRGIEIKKDTYANIQVRRTDGTSIPLVDAGGSYGIKSGPDPTNYSVDVNRRRRGATTKLYTNFIIQNIEDSRQEKTQLIETFGDTYIFFFGERPRVLNVSGLLFNSFDFNWRSEFWVNYENTLRGTKLVEQNAKIYLHWDDIVVEGYMLGASAQDNAEMPYHIPFQFQLFVTNHTYLGNVGDENFPVRNWADIEPFQNPQALTNKLAESKERLARAKATADMVKSVTQFAKNMGLATSAVALREIAGKGYSKSGVNTVLTSAFKAGLLSQALTFMSVMDNYLRTRWAANQKVLYPARTKIRDNWDEYVGTSDHNPNGDKVFDQDAIAWAKTRQKAVQTFTSAVNAVVLVLNEMAVDPIWYSDPDYRSPWDHKHSISVAKKNQATDIKQFSPSSITSRPSSSYALGNANKPTKPETLSE